MTPLDDRCFWCGVPLAGGATVHTPACWLHPEQLGIDQGEALALFRTMSAEALACAAAAYAIDRAEAVHESTRQFCEHRLAWIDQVLRERLGRAGAGRPS